MQRQYDLKSLKVKRRGPLPGLTDEDGKSAKVRVTIALDADVVEYFKSAADEPGGLPYQTQINQALRRIIKHPDDTKNLKNALLHDPDFIQKVAQQVPRD